MDMPKASHYYYYYYYAYPQRNAHIMYVVHYTRLLAEKQIPFRCEDKTWKSYSFNESTTLKSFHIFANFFCVFIRGCLSLFNSKNGSNNNNHGAMSSRRWSDDVRLTRLRHIWNSTKYSLKTQEQS